MLNQPLTVPSRGVEPLLGERSSNLGLVDIAIRVQIHRLEGLHGAVVRIQLELLAIFLLLRGRLDEELEEGLELGFREEREGLGVRVRVRSVRFRGPSLGRAFGGDSGLG